MAGIAVRKRVTALALAFATLAVVEVGPAAGQASSPLHGYVREAGTGEPIVVAEVTAGNRATAVTDRHGYFRTAAVAGDSTRVRVRAYGYARLDTVVAVTPRPLELRLERVPVRLNGLQVRARRARDSLELPMPGFRLVGREELLEVPAGLQADLMRSLQALPGVVAASPVSSRLLVRGGGPDQNQLLLDGFPILYPYHLAGAFSSFDVDAVQDVAFWPGAPPARYGGHLSSVVDVALRDGNRERTTGEATLGFVTSGAEVEGPVPAGAFMLSARRTYIDALARIPGGRFPYYFWDTTAKVHFDLGRSDRITAVGFYGHDRLRRVMVNDSAAGEPENEDFRWRNGTFGISWRHLFGAGAVFRQHVSRSMFAQRLTGANTERGAHALVASSHDVTLWSARGELEVLGLPAQRLTLGYEAGRRTDGHDTEYWTWSELLDALEVTERELAARGLAPVLSGYAEDRLAIGPASLRLGLRAERFDTTTLLQPRVAVGFRPRPGLELHGWWGRVAQYEQVIQDPDLGLASLYSVDIWLPADAPGGRVSRGEHAGLGASLALPLDLDLQLDLYSKRMDGLAVVPDATDAERTVAIQRLQPADGRVRGLDLTLRRSVAEGLSGWLGYSYLHARTLAGGADYPATRQPRNRFVTVLDWSDGRWRFDTRFEAFEGLPYTPALASFTSRPFDLGDGARPSTYCQATSTEFLYGDLNSARTGLSKRMDVSARYTAPTRWGWSYELGFSIYNLLFDAPGIFRPQHYPSVIPIACESPESVEREPEIQLPAVPSVTLRVVF